MSVMAIDRTAEKMLVVTELVHCTKLLRKGITMVQTAQTSLSPHLTAEPLTGIAS